LPLDVPDLPTDRMVAPAELNPEGHHHAGNVTAAEDGVASSHCDERSDRVVDVTDEGADFRVPRLSDPVDDTEGEVFLAGEEVVQGTSRVAGLGGNSFEDQVGVPIPREAARRCFQQGVPGVGAALRLRPSRSTPDGRCGQRHASQPTDMNVC
jgi:hypothetical protein